MQIILRSGPWRDIKGGNMSNYKVSMDNYYTKSTNIKSGMQNTVDDVQKNFLDKVSSNKDSLDSRDMQMLLGTESYTNAVADVSAAKEGPLPKLNNMSSENDNNPMNPIVKTDREYQAKFQNFVDGKRSEEISAEVKEIEFTFEARKQLEYWIKLIPKDFNPELLKQIQQFMKTDPRKAFEILYGSKEFWELVIESNPANQEKYLNFLQVLERFPGYVKLAKRTLYNQEWFWNLLYNNRKLDDIFFAVISSPEAAKQIPATIAEKLYNSDWFFDALGKGPEWLQSKVLDAMAVAEDGTFWSKLISKTDKFTGYLSKVTGYMEKIKSGKLVQAMSKLIKSPLAKKLTNNPVVKKLLGPWGGIIIDAGFSGFVSYNDPKDPAYHSIGKAAFSGGIDSIKNANLLDGIMIGASIGGPWGAVGGAGVILLKDGLNYLFPNWDKKLKEGFNGLYDKVANSDFGKGVTNTVNSVKQTVGNAFHNGEKVVKNFIADGAKKLFANVPKLGWFG